MSSFPKEWSKHILDDLLEDNFNITYGVVQPGEEVANGVKFIRGGDFPKGKIEENRLRTISHEVSESYKRTVLNGGELLVALVGYPGTVAIVPNSLKGANIARQTALIRLAPEYLNKYVKYFLESDFGQGEILRGSLGSAQQVINLKDLKLVQIYTPKIDEQNKIAEILTSVDKVIELTEIEIEKLKNLKKGMMQDLLTKGIGHTKFKDSPIGKIPESWEIKTVQEIATVVDSLHKTPAFSETGYNMIRVTDIIEGDLKFNNSLKVSEEVYLDFSRNHKPVKGDIVMTRVGSFGRSSYVNTDIAFCIGQNTVIIHPQNNSKYLYYFLNSEIAWNQIINKTNGSSQGSLSLKAIKELKVSTPGKDELSKIVGSLDSVSNQIELKLEKFNKLKDIKKGLMQDLLTGKVRVKV